METPLRLWLDAYRAPLIPMPREFSWQCDLGRWRSLEPCFALCVKIIIIFQYATMWLPLHTEVQYLHSGYQILVNSCIFIAYVCSTGSSCGQQVSTLLICQTFVANHALSNASRSIYLFLAQWRLVLPWKCCFACFIKCCFLDLLLSLLPWQWFSITLMLYHKIYELFYLWCQTNLKLQENCAINAQAAIHLKLQL